MKSIVCDLVLLSWNHLEETRPCLESLLETTRVPCRLLIVDNGSEPDVRNFLSVVKPRGAIKDVQLLQNETNEGFPRGMNRGIQASTSQYVCLLNNDLRFAVGWMREMMRVAEANPTVGVINPTSSTFGNYPPRGMSLQAYADSLLARSGRFVEVGMCIGFCMLIKREVLDKVGGLSEEVERIFFEDEDFCMRAQRAGYRSVVAEAAYVYHAEHKTVQKMPEREGLFSRNRKWCEEKWGRRLRVAWPRFAPVIPGSPELRAFLDRVVAVVRERTLVYVYAPIPEGMTGPALFESVGLVPHADVHWRAVPEPVAALASAGYILKRRKKRFDIITAPQPAWGRSLRSLRWLHQAGVVAQDDEAALRVQMKRRAFPWLEQP